MCVYIYIYRPRKFRGRRTRAVGRLGIVLGARREASAYYDYHCYYHHYYHHYSIIIIVVFMCLLSSLWLLLCLLLLVVVVVPGTTRGLGRGLFSMSGSLAERCGDDELKNIKLSARKTPYACSNAHSYHLRPFLTSCRKEVVFCLPLVARKLKPVSSYCLPTLTV